MHNPLLVVHLRMDDTACSSFGTAMHAMHDVFLCKISACAGTPAWLLSGLTKGDGMLGLYTKGGGALAHRAGLGQTDGGREGLGVTIRSRHIRGRVQDNGSMMQANH